MSNQMFKRRDPAKMAKQLEEAKGGNSYNQDDGTEWSLTTDNAGNGNAVIRFLPPANDESLPFIKLVNHGFKISGNKWYINNCTSTHGDFESCPVCSYMKENNTYETNEALYGKLKRKISYWANILVIKDPANPENEGKVFKYRFGKKILDKIDAMIQVDPDLGEDPVDVFCPFEGANFILKSKKVGGFANYEDSKFQKQSAIPKIDTDEYQEFLFKSLHDLESMKTFEDKEKLQKEFNLVMGTASLGTAAESASREADAIGQQLDQFEIDMNSFETESTAKETKQSSPSDSDDLNDLMAELDK